MPGVAAGAELPRWLALVTNTRPGSLALGALGRLAVAVLEEPLARPSLLATTGAVGLTPPNWTRSTVVWPPGPSDLVKLSVSVPDPLALLAVVIQYAH